MNGCIFKRKWSAGSLILLVLTAFAGCGTAYYEPRVPTVDAYMPGVNVEAGIRAPDASVSEQPQTSQDIPGKQSALALDACARIALAENPVNRAAQEGVAAAKEATGQARAAYYPEVGIQTGYSRWQRHAFLPNGVVRPGVPSTIGPTDDWIASLQARFTLFDSGQRRAQLRAAMARKGVAEQDAERVKQDILLEVHKAFYGLVAATESRTVAEQNLARAEAHFELAEARRLAGAVAKADVLRAQVELADAKLSLVRAESLIRIAGGSLNTAMGLPVEMPVEVEPPGARISPPSEINLSEAFDQAVSARPALKAALQRIAESRHAVEEAKSAFGPRIRTEGTYGWQDDAFLPEDERWLAGVTIDLPVFNGFSRMHDLRRRRAEMKREEAETGWLVQAVRQEVWSAYSEIQEAYEAFLAAEVLVRNAEESMRSTRERYEVGADTITDLLDTQTALARAEATRVEAQWDWYAARASLDWAVGRLQIQANEKS